MIEENSKGKAICYNCEDIKAITYLVRDVPFSDNSGVVEDLLVGVCDDCDSVITTPHQSTPKIKEKLKKLRSNS